MINIMVVGNGMIAKKFSSYSDNEAVVIFASGVSDSTNTDPGAFEREFKLIQHTITNNPDKLFVYFSTCSILDKFMQQSAYVQHKINMEKYIRDNHSRYNIFRLSNPIGHTNNTHTVVNYFINHLINRQPFVIWKNAARNIIDIDDLFLLCHEIINDPGFTNSIVHIANPKNYPVIYIIKCIESHFNIEGNYTQIDQGGGPEIETGLDELFVKLNINFDKDYLPRLLQKYFPV